mmetsp:Transcript_17233/g.26118  ORF Transcript_17233/g.26118 Transcript_17233/m.26118 type:complete len:150 (-) Transcript_17233:862-1311(-)
MMIIRIFFFISALALSSGFVQQLRNLDVGKGGKIECEGLLLSQKNGSNYPTEVEKVGPTMTTTSMRKILQVEKFARLPVWPVWNGVAIFVISKLFGNEFAAKLEDMIGGRVCPNFFIEGKTSPFIMLVHHRHSFASWDILRYLQRTFFP